ncbi:unnamed protein product, partial [Ectocarpus sp. 13 AM-2016]
WVRLVVGPPIRGFEFERNACCFGLCCRRAAAFKEVTPPVVDCTGLFLFFLAWNQSTRGRPGGWPAFRLVLLCLFWGCVPYLAIFVSPGLLLELLVVNFLSPDIQSFLLLERRRGIGGLLPNATSFVLFSFCVCWFDCFGFFRSGRGCKRNYARWDDFCPMALQYLSFFRTQGDRLLSLPSDLSLSLSWSVATLECASHWDRNSGGTNRWKFHRKFRYGRRGRPVPKARHTRGTCSNLFVPVLVGVLLHPPPGRRGGAPATLVNRGCVCGPRGWRARLELEGRTGGTWQKGTRDSSESLLFVRWQIPLVSDGKRGRGIIEVLGIRSRMVRSQQEGKMKGEEAVLGDARPGSIRSAG